MEHDAGVNEASQGEGPSDLLTPAVPIKNCPIATSLGVLGRKWTILILRDMSMMKMERFNQLLKATPGLTPRILSHRLSELEKEGIIERAERRKGPNFVRWRLTEKGNDTIPILMRFRLRIEVVCRPGV